MLYQLSYTPKPASFRLLAKPKPRKSDITPPAAVEGLACELVGCAAATHRGRSAMSTERRIPGDCPSLAPSVASPPRAAERVRLQGTIMNKLVVVAALVGTIFAAPALPAQAASMMSDAQTNCLIFPLLKKECWEMGAKAVAAAPEAVAMAVEDTAAEVKMPMKWWTCTAAPKGSGHLVDC